MVGQLQDDILAVFPREWVYGPKERANATGGQWPSMDAMLAQGRRVVFVSGVDYGDAMRPLVFAKGEEVCGWTEPPLGAVDGAPSCRLDPSVGGSSTGGSNAPGPGFFDGQIVRLTACELQYGPMNCEFAWGHTNAPLLDETSLPPVVECGINIPSPDLLTPARAAAAVWTWAPGHPYVGVGWDGAATVGASSIPGEASRWRLGSFPSSWWDWIKRHLLPHGKPSPPPAPGPTSCAILAAEDARWRAVSCDPGASGLPSACRKVLPGQAPEDSVAEPSGVSPWVLGPPGTPGSCPNGTAFDVPRHPRENFLLAAVLRGAGATGAWLPIKGPLFAVDGHPALESRGPGVVMS
jgi:hypothetical protein